MIKLKAWEKNMKEIIPVHNIDFEKKMINTNGAWRMFHEIELIQFSGLKDRNGREVFEGDVYEYTTSYEASDPFGEITTLEIKGLDTVTFENGAFYHGPHLLSDVIEHDDSLTYIGNIYEINKLAGENQ